MATIIQTKNVYAKLQKARVLIQNRNLKKSGYNSFAKFHYYELGDFIPVVNQVFSDLGLMSNFSIAEQCAKLTIINTENPNEHIEFESILPNIPENKGSNPMQALGSMHTYMKRYLYLNVLELTENDTIDATIGKPNSTIANKSSLEENTSDVFYSINNSRSLDDLNKVLADFKTDMSKEAKNLLHHMATEKYHGGYQHSLGKYVAAAAM